MPMCNGHDINFTNLFDAMPTGTITLIFGESRKKFGRRQPPAYQQLPLRFEGSIITVLRGYRRFYDYRSPRLPLAE